MHTIFRTLRTGAFLAALILAAAPAAHAQVQTEESPEFLRSGVQGYGYSRNQQLINQAVRDFGFRPSRLRRDDVLAIDRAWARVVPGVDRRRYALNQEQATAIVYLALVHRRGGYAGTGRWDDRGRDDGRWDERDGRGDGRWDDRDDQDGGRFEETRGPRPIGACGNVDVQAYELWNVVNAPRQATLFLNSEEKQQVRALATEIQREALRCGDRTVADRAADVIGSLSPTLPTREDVSRRARALRDATDTGSGSGRRIN